VNPGMTSAPVARSVSKLVKLRRSVPVTLSLLFSR